VYPITVKPQNIRGFVESSHQSTILN